MNLDQFLRQARDPRFHCRDHVEEPGFSTMYVRFGRRYVRGELFHDTLDLANIEVFHPGNGTFKKLIARLREQYPHIHLFVERVLSPRFRYGLLKMGFEYVGPSYYSPCFFMQAAKKKGEIEPEKIESVLGSATES